MSPLPSATSVSTATGLSSVPSLRNGPLTAEGSKRWRREAHGLAALGRAQRVGDRRRPARGARIAQQQRPRARPVGLGLLAQEPVRDLADPRRRQLVRREARQPVARASTDRVLGHAEHLGQLTVRASLAKDELDGGALIWRQPVERGGAATRRHLLA